MSTTENQNQKQSLASFLGAIGAIAAQDLGKTNAPISETFQNSSSEAKGDNIPETLQPSFADFLNRLIEDYEDPNKKEVTGEVEFIPSEFSNKKITIKIAVTDLDTNEKQKSKVNVISDAAGAFSLDADTGIVEATTPLERVGVIFFSSVLGSVNGLVQEVVNNS